MSSSQIGSVYENVISATVGASTEDFIDSGLSLDILETLKENWQQKLAASGVAAFSWQRDDDSTQPHLSQSSRKIDGFHNPALAAIRASQQLQEFASKGDRNGHDDAVQASINGLRELAAEQAARSSSVKQEHHSNGTSPDPSGWSTSTLKRRISEVSDTDPHATGRAHPDFSLQYTHPAGSGTTAVTSYVDDEVITPPAVVKRRPDPNDDTIGSDLDDSGEEEDIDSDVGEDGEENMPLMLCLYDKVHRTKNKWRANLSNGIVCINGREWVFEKANGEYEW